jgi:hypothetical protein
MRRLPIMTDTKDGRLAKYQVCGLSTIVGCDKSVITLFSLSPIRWNGQQNVVCRYEVMATHITLKVSQHQPHGAMKIALILWSMFKDICERIYGIEDCHWGD